MSALETNSILAAEILAALRAAGVRTLVVCPGGRNAPLVLAADAARDMFEVLTFPEERSAAFFALGRIRRDGVPVAVLTTSGTAAAELLPAMLEAVHGGWPLLAVTADRPRRLRATGAPQTIDQPPLFGAAHVPIFDIETPGTLNPLPSGALHLNVCFEEPLAAHPIPLPPRKPGQAAAEPSWMNEDEARRHGEEFFSHVKNPLVLVSSLTSDEARTAAPWLASLSCPLYLEGISQLRGHRDLEEFSLRSGERILSSPECRAACDGILRLGGVPTPRFWRSLKNDPRPILHVSRTPLPGMTRGAVVPWTLFHTLSEGRVPGGKRHADLFARDRAMAAAVESLLTQEPHSEVALVRSAAMKFAPNARIFLGNSLAIREWDLAAPHAASERAFFANRGVNGIDGLVSTALGLASSERPMAALIGDLSALYDLVGLWGAAPQCGADITLAVINNGGGKIFHRLFNNDAFSNAHALQFRSWAEMFGWHYAQVRSPDDPWPTSSPRLVEILPDTASTKRFDEAHDALWC